MIITRRQFSSLSLGTALAGAFGYPALAASGPVDTSKVSKDITAKATGKKFTMATVVKVDG
jgi:simple sugar transport system substrate-binding protein